MLYLCHLRPIITFKYFQSLVTESKLLANNTISERSEQKTVRIMERKLKDIGWVGTEGLSTKLLTPVKKMISERDYVSVHCLTWGN